jgi:hypothetical protein
MESFILPSLPPELITIFLTKPSQNPNSGSKQNIEKTNTITVPKKEKNDMLLPKVFSPVPSLTKSINNNNNNNNGMNKQYTQELSYAPISPKLNHVTTITNPSVKTHKSEPVATEPCCICYDEEIPTHNLLKSNHPVCSECTEQLQKSECPMCDKFLEGPLVTDEILAKIINREEQGKADELSRNYLTGLYMEEHPNVDPSEIYGIYS